MKLTPIIQVFIFNAIIIGISLILESFYPGLINSGWFVPLITLLVGSFAIYLYLKKQEDHKREAANIILTEMRNAEKGLEQIRGMGPTDEIRKIFILPVNSWIKYNHLFVRDFDRDELDLINDFYSKCTLAEQAVNEIKEALCSQIRKKLESTQYFLGQIAKEAISDADYEVKRDAFLKRFQGEGHVSKPNQYFKDLAPVLDISKITVSMVGNKFKKIAKIN
ncbi:MAG: hypothetical protein HQ537_00240 [Parcubacteria group bacterium]|nr:hypothetical protein [Parcubacteria group bacterium]